MKENIGRVTFEVQDRLVVADPCYVDEGDSLESLADLGVVLNGCAGTWEATVSFKAGRTSVLHAERSDYEHNPFTSCWERLSENAGVDSGQMFIGCASGTPLNYQKVLDHYRTGLKGEWEDKDFFGHGEGVVSATGWGDGCYPIYVKRDARGDPVAVEVRFQEDMEEYEDEEERD